MLTGQIVLVCKSPLSLISFLINPVSAIVQNLQHLLAPGLEAAAVISVGNADGLL